MTRSEIYALIDAERIRQDAKHPVFAHIGERPLNKAEAHRVAHKLRDPKFYTARTKRAVNSLTVERGPKAVPHE